MSFVFSATLVRYRPYILRSHKYRASYSGSTLWMQVTHRVTSAPDLDQTLNVLTNLSQCSQCQISSSDGPSGHCTVQLKPVPKFYGILLTPPSVLHFPINTYRNCRKTYFGVGPRIFSKSVAFNST